MKNKIKKELEKYLKEEKANLKSIESYLITNFTERNESLLGYSLVERTSECDVWIEAITGVEKGGMFLGIVFNYSVGIDYEDNNFDDVVEELYFLYKECKKVKKILGTN